VGELIFVGLGLAGTKDLTLRALDAVRHARTVFAEFYTSHLVGATHSQLERELDKRIVLLARDEVESGAERILDAAAQHRTAFVTAGDPMTATTHQDLRIRALRRGIPVRIVHGVSIQVAAAGAAGLHSYKFGRTTTLVFPQPNFNPASPYETVRDNRARGLHTLVLLDLRADEGRYMSAAQGIEVLLGHEQQRRESVVTPDTELVALARVGADDQRVVWGPAKRLREADLGPPLHCLIVPGELHFSEREALELVAAPRV
jgi:diphthine synthase